MNSEPIEIILGGDKFNCVYGNDCTDLYDEDFELICHFYGIASLEKVNTWLTGYRRGLTVGQAIGESSIRNEIKKALGIK